MDEENFYHYLECEFLRIWCRRFLRNFPRRFRFFFRTLLMLLSYSNEKALGRPFENPHRLEGSGGLRPTGPLNYLTTISRRSVEIILAANWPTKTMRL